MRVSRGFTLIELLFVIAAATILLTVGIPSFQNSVRNSRLTASVNDIVASMQVARSEAIKRRGAVIMCTSGGATDAAAGCVDDAPWHQGWLVFSDDNDNGSRDAGEILLRLENPMRRGINVVVPPQQPMQDQLIYSSNGFPAVGGLNAAGLMVFCDSQASDFFGRVVTVPQTGRPASFAILSRPDLQVSCE